eukprot:2608465-Rhodomonas_salina.1
MAGRVEVSGEGRETKGWRGMLIGETYGTRRRVCEKRGMLKGEVRPWRVRRVHTYGGGVTSPRRRYAYWRGVTYEEERHTYRRSATYERREAYLWERCDA